MKKETYLVLAVMSCTIFGACSGAVDESTKQNNSPAGNSNANVVSNGSVVAGPQPMDINAVPVANANLAEPGSGMIGVSNSVQRKLDEMRKSGASGPQVDPAVLAAKNAKPAPDNSTFYSYLGDMGYEVRTFKSHPKLLKVEKTTTSDGKQFLKIFVRGGQVIELPGHRINPLSTAPASLILMVAGLERPAVETEGPPIIKKKQDGN
jgi:hypothetical protein